MFDTGKFGKYLSGLRKNADMTQSELADKLNLTRQAVSRYELGDSFPDISVLISIADTFHVTIDELVNAGEPTSGESHVLKGLAHGDQTVAADDITDVLSLAPWLKPSVLAKLSERFYSQGIDITHIVELAEYLNDDGILQIIGNADLCELRDDLLEKFIPLLSDRSKLTIFQKILDGEIDWHFLSVLLPYSYFPDSLIEAAVMEGVFPQEALRLVQEANIQRMKNNDE